MSATRWSHLISLLVLTFNSLHCAVLTSLSVPQLFQLSLDLLFSSLPFSTLLLYSAVVSLLLLLSISSFHVFSTFLFISPPVICPHFSPLPSTPFLSPCCSFSYLLHTCLLSSPYSLIFHLLYRIPPSILVSCPCLYFYLLFPALCVLFPCSMSSFLLVVSHPSLLYFSHLSSTLACFVSPLPVYSIFIIVM